MKRRKRLKSGHAPETNTEGDNLKDLRMGRTGRRMPAQLLRYRRHQTKRRPNKKAKRLDTHRNEHGGSNMKDLGDGPDR
jgi:hypothetical protein